MLLILLIFLVCSIVILLLVHRQKDREWRQQINYLIHYAQQQPPAQNLAALDIAPNISNQREQAQISHEMQRKNNALQQQLQQIRTSGHARQRDATGILLSSEEKEHLASEEVLSELPIFSANTLAHKARLGEHALTEPALNESRLSETPVQIVTLPKDFAEKFSDNRNLTRKPPEHLSATARVNSPRTHATRPMMSCAPHDSSTSQRHYEELQVASSGTQKPPQKHSNIITLDDAQKALKHLHSNKNHNNINRLKDSAAPKRPPKNNRFVIELEDIHHALRDTSLKAQEVAHQAADQRVQKKVVREKIVLKDNYANLLTPHHLSQNNISYQQVILLEPAHNTANSFTGSPSITPTVAPNVKHVSAAPDIQPVQIATPLEPAGSSINSPAHPVVNPPIDPNAAEAETLHNPLLHQTLTLPEMHTHASTIQIAPPLIPEHPAAPSTLPRPDIFALPPLTPFHSNTLAGSSNVAGSPTLTPIATLDLVDQTEHIAIFNCTNKNKDLEHPTPPVITPPVAPIVTPNIAPMLNISGTPLLPDLNLLAAPNNETSAAPSEESLLDNGITIEEKLAEFKVKVNVVDAFAGPVITRYEIEPAQGVRGSQVVNLEKDLARSLGFASIRVVETIPGKTCMGLELPNPKRQMIRLREIFDSPAFKDSRSKLTLALGRDITGEPIVTDLAKAPHLLVAGTTGSGKSVGVNGMILSILFKATPDEVRLIMIDPKMLELSIYEGIPHLLSPVVTDMRLAANALTWCVNEMEKRYRLMSHVGVRNLASYNEKVTDAALIGSPIASPFSLNPDEPEPLEKLPFIVVIVDEFADLMMTAGKKIEELIARLAQKARAAGIHLILATQRPSVDVITGLIKANIPTRIAFQVSSKVDSRTILDQMGAESLLGQGDMLFLPPGTGYPNRVHGAFVADEEVHRVVEYLKQQFGKPNYIDDILTAGVGEDDLFSNATSRTNTQDDADDPLYDEAIACVVKSRKASISSVQRQLRIGYNRAARLIEQMENDGIVSAPEGSGNRTVLAPMEQP